ncbi:MAG: hypothetical protein J6P16_02165, partial [Eubacterium sp.]|nr:hypothetical protein [Eubacterium sp.]
MLRSRGKRVVAGFLALTLFLTSGFLILFRDSVFGARNNNSAVEPNYIDEASKTGVSVSVRGKGSQGSVILTDEGSNQKDKLPNTFYKGWEFNGEDGTISIPSTIGKKGSKDNPFVVLEVVPDKGMQEMPYFVGGGDDTGLGFDEGYLSATLMEQLREKNGESFRLTNGAFTVERMNNDPNLKNTYDSFINDKITNVLNDTFGRFLQSKFNVFGIGQEVDETASTNDTLQMVDVYNNEGADKVGTYNFNEIYNISITTDDLLQILPTKVIRSLGANPSASEIANDRAENKWAFHEISNKNEIFEREYTQDLIAFVAAETNKTTDQLTAVDIENYIKDVLCGVSLGYNQLTDKNGNNQINKTTEIIKYNLKDFSQADWLKPGLGQDITYLDYEDSEIFDFYDISQSIVRRGSGYNTRHYELKQRGEDGKGTFSYLPGSPKKEVSNYWKVQFRKKYIDTFTSYFADYKAKDEAWKAAEPTNPNESLSDSAMNKLRARNAALEKLMKTFAPFFESKGVNIKTMSDPMNWETTTKTVLSNVREYKIDHAGGYILAVKPGMGDMYLLNDNQISNIVDKFSDEEKEAMGVNSSDYLNKTFVFSRDDLDSVVDGEVTDNTNQRRWIFVPTSFALDGDMTPHKDYHPGYLDDSDYTYGFASKTVRNKDDITLAIYDRSNRRHHGRNESGKNDFNKANVGNFSFKSTESFNMSGQLVNNGALSF